MTKQWFFVINIMNLTFLNPFLLWLIPVSLFPILLHLFYKKRPKRIPFSDIRLIQLAMKNVLPRTKLHQWLLLLLRCLILLLLFLVAARPVGYSGYFGKKSKTQQLIILMDASYSMMYTESGITRFTKSKQFMNKLIGELLSRRDKEIVTGHKQISIVVFSDYIERAVPNFSNDIEYLQEFISDTSVSYRTSDLSAGLSFCYKTFSEMPSGGNRTIIVVSDLCRHILPEAAVSKFDIEAVIPEYDPSVRVIFLAVNNGETENTCIEKVQIMDSPLRFIPAVRNFSGPRSRWQLTLNINKKPVLSDLLNISRDKVVEHEFKYNVGIKGLITGSVALQEDNLGVDDKYYFAYNPQISMSVLIVDGDPKFGNTIDSESYYIDTALSGGKFTTKVVTLDELKQTNIQRYDAVIMCNIDKIPSEKLPEITNKPLILSLGNKSAPENYPLFLSKSIGEIEKGVFKISELSKSSSFIKKSDEFELDRIIFRQKFRLYGGDSLVNFDDGTSLLIEKNIADNKVLIFGSSIDRDWTNFPFKPFYPYFMRSLVEYCTERDRADDVVRFLSVGEPIKYTYEGKERLTSAEITFKNLKVGLTGSHNQVLFERADVPGMYKLEIGNKVVFFAVNVDRSKSESNLTRVDTSKLKKMFHDTPVWILESGKTTLKDIISLLEGKELTKFFLMFALFLLGLEIILANTKL